MIRGDITMMKNSNADYIMKNLGHDISTVDWIYSIKAFFGDEKSEEFFADFIRNRQILRINDIRRLFSSASMSVYSKSSKEQLAFLSLYKPINADNALIRNMENGFEKAQKLYRKKSIALSKHLKELGYSYSTTWANWKDKNKHDTYQREYVFIIFSEKDTSEEFKNNIINLAKENNISSVLITDFLENDDAKLQIKSKLYNVENEEMIQQYEDTTIEVVEKYLSSLTNTKVLFKIPYERNKTILCVDNNEIADYYSKAKQEKIRRTRPLSFNAGIWRQALINSFDKDSYNK